MKIDLNDPRITAFALGELKGQDAIEIARAVQRDERVREAVDAVRETSGMLLETLGANQSQLLTAEQREAIRRAGARPVIADISSAGVSFWKRPAVAGIGVAAAVALAFYIVGGRPGGGAGDGLSDPQGQWDWAQVDMQSLTDPVAGDHHTGSSIASDDGSGQASVKSVSAAISDDTTGYRKELQQRIDELKAEEILSASSLPDPEDNAALGWNLVDAGYQMNVPLAAGATSWPWIVRAIDREGKLPPSRAVRIEEIVNHFRYKKPDMMRGGGFVADMEICQTPWNPLTVLLAVHVAVDPDAPRTEPDSSPESSRIAPVRLALDSEQVKRARLLGYKAVKPSGVSNPSPEPVQASRSQGNYVIYELEMIEGTVSNDDTPVASLIMGQQEDEKHHFHSQINPWSGASADLRFASTLSACGTLLDRSSQPGQLGRPDVKLLLTMLDSIEQQDADSLGGDRREALGLLRRAVGMMELARDE